MFHHCIRGKRIIAFHRSETLYSDFIQKALVIPSMAETNLYTLDSHRLLTEMFDKLHSQCEGFSALVLDAHAAEVIFSFLNSVTRSVKNVQLVGSLSVVQFQR
jgi:hypothetical protein